ncbi:MAG TPA: sigma factor [Anaerohalosphaeraceae bacterium]|nr:sigma factor [Anaerohalosphaeraceae bacterium]
MANKQPPTYAPFPVTIWTMIEQAKNRESPEGREAIEQFAALYWKPIYAFYRSQGYSFEKAEDLTQGFLADFFEKQKIDSADCQRGRFRTFLLTCARNYLIDEYRRGSARERGRLRKLLRWEQIRSQTGPAIEPSDEETPEQVYQSVWRRELLNWAVQAVQERCREKDRQVCFEVFTDYYLQNEQDRPTWDQVAAKYHLNSWKEASHKAEWVKQQFIKAIRGEIRVYTKAKSEEEVDEELRELLSF